MRKKEKAMKERRILSAGIIVNLILATFAFAFLISLIYTEEVSGASINDIYTYGGSYYKISGDNMYSWNSETSRWDAAIIGGELSPQEWAKRFTPLSSTDFEGSAPTDANFWGDIKTSTTPPVTPVAAATSAFKPGFVTSTQKIITDANGQKYLVNSGDPYGKDVLQVTKLGGEQSGVSGTFDPNILKIKGVTDATQLDTLTKGGMVKFSDGNSYSYEELLKGSPDAVPDLAKMNEELAKAGYTNVKPGESFDYRGTSYKFDGTAGALTSAGKAETFKPVSTLFGEINSQLWGGIIQGATWAVAVGGAIQLVGGLIGLEQAQTNSISLAAMGGIFAGRAAYGVLQSAKAGEFFKFINTGGAYNPVSWTQGQQAWFSAGLGVVAFLIILQLTWKEKTSSAVELSCLPWEAPIGGKRCQDCNKDPLRPCSEYRCKSLGQACELVNAGSGNESCIWQNPKDVSSPIIVTNATFLTSGYKYNPNIVIRPAKRGVAIERIGDDKCIKAFTPIRFGFNTNEPAKCKIDYNHTAEFDDMAFDFGETSLYLYEHVQKLSLPGPKSMESQGGSPNIINDGEYSLFVRCQDKNGNVNEDEFSFKFCVEKGPDTTPPEMITTNFGKEAPFTYNLSSLAVSLYVNEPADCRWSRDDRTYDSMEYNMSCMSNIEDMTPDLVYICKSTLTALKNNVDNKFYFRCKDQPYAEEVDRNKNSQSFVLNLKGTKPLNIYSVSPNNETVKGFGETIQVNVEVETRNGYNDAAFCYFSSTNREENYILFAETESRISRQRLDLTAGSYTYYIKCVDLGGNSVYQTISFKVESDNLPPRVVRAYKTNEQLTIITDEESTCSYSTSSCNFNLGEGIAMPNDNSKGHSMVWDVSKRYFIKCKDKYENEPAPTECNTIVRGFNSG